MRIHTTLGASLLVAFACFACSSSSSGGGGGGGGDGGTGEGGGSGDHPIRSSDYDQSCTTSDDCVATVTGDACGVCNCPNDSINASAKSKYDHDYAALTTTCPKRGVAISCEACAPSATVCDPQTKKCTFEKCTQPSSDPHSCGGSSDAGSD